ncbi:hypothetical protein SELMODRAFT_424766 [Selaginella moellendorffii]|uniref:Uncharacterized protein n=1 Tax=Selaginella moellendorffii TaxID=88036 RepID=D8SQZ9_SELML|nr:hypothetical protein SELMODRAFT_424766 [Selaginella moellendorffii]
MAIRRRQGAVDAAPAFLVAVRHGAVDAAGFEPQLAMALSMPPHLSSSKCQVKDKHGVHLRPSLLVVAKLPDSHLLGDPVLPVSADQVKHSSLTRYRDAVEREQERRIGASCEVDCLFAAAGCLGSEVEGHSWSLDPPPRSSSRVKHLRHSLTAAQVVHDSGSSNDDFEGVGSGAFGGEKGDDGCSGHVGGLERWEIPPRAEQRVTNNEVAGMDGLEAQESSRRGGYVRGIGRQEGEGNGEPLVAGSIESSQHSGSAIAVTLEHEDPGEPGRGRCYSRLQPCKPEQALDWEAREDPEEQIVWEATPYPRVEVSDPPPAIATAATHFHPFPSHELSDYIYIKNDVRSTIFKALSDLFSSEEWPAPVGHKQDANEEFLAGKPSLVVAFPDDVSFIVGMLLIQQQQQRDTSVLSNISSQVLLYIGMVDTPIQGANAALDGDKFHVKSLFRKASALKAIGEYTQAVECFELALSRSRARQGGHTTSPVLLRWLEATVGAMLTLSVLWRSKLASVDVVVLVVSNPIAMLYFTGIEDVKVEVVRACMGSSKALVQLNSLADCLDKVPEIPDMDMSKPNVSHTSLVPLALAFPIHPPRETKMTECSTNLPKDQSDAASH